MTRGRNVGWSQERRAKGTRKRMGLAALALASLLLTSCASSPSPAEMCLSIEASPNLNQFDGAPHVVVLYFYPLQNLMAYRQTDPVELLNGGRPPGLTGDPWEITILPGAVRELEETLPLNTRFVGILADFYNGPSQAVVEAACPMFGSQTVVLSASDVQVR